jgi:two-component system, NtrC family, response regulator HydG
LQKLLEFLSWTGVGMASKTQIIKHNFNSPDTWEFFKRLSGFLITEKVWLEGSKSMKEKILIVEDHFIESNNLQNILEKAGYLVAGVARSYEEALELVTKKRPSFVLVDIFLHGTKTGIDLALDLRIQKIPFIYISANTDTKTLAQAKETYPYGFLVKPFREKDVLVMIEIARYHHLHSLEAFIRKGILDANTNQPVMVEKGNDFKRLFPEPVDGNSFYGIIGKSEKLRTVLKLVQLVAPSSTSVIILGETGTGKESVAKTIHELSQRKGKPLIKVNCAALPPDLVESILFGHERGAFTGAVERSIGKFEQANGGTLFLDEIGDIPPIVQVKLLRALQEKEIERIGGNKTIPVNVRIIAATNKDLEKEVAEGRFRMDLYYRLKVFPITLPPLRDRVEDIPLLAFHFLEYYCAEFNRKIKGFSLAQINELTRYFWPGNIRELRHTIERTVLMTEGAAIKQLGMPEESLKPGANESKVKTIEEHERDYIEQIIRKCNGKISGPGGAAELLGINVSTLNSRMKKLGIGKMEGCSFKTFSAKK